MKLCTVTLTGADDSVSPDQLADLSDRYPYVEWAILFSQSKTGSPRYPTVDWINKLAALWGLKDLSSVPLEPRKVQLAAHLCGKWVDDVVGGHFTFLDQKYAEAFHRIQLNLGKERLVQVVSEPKKLLGTLVNSNLCGHPIILGGNYRHVAIDAEFFEDSGFYPLFDGSGGRGRLAEEWPSPYYVLGLHWCTPLYCGYAGGLGPNNVAQELEKIQKVAVGADIWIDMETSLRDADDRFCLDKCAQVLENVKKSGFIRTI